MEVAAALNMGMLSGDVVVLPSAAAEVGGALCFAVAMRSVSCVARAMRSTFSLALGRTVLNLAAAMPLATASHSDVCVMTTAWLSLVNVGSLVALAAYLQWRWERRWPCKWCRG